MFAACLPLTSRLKMCLCQCASTRSCQVQKWVPRQSSTLSLAKAYTTSGPVTHAQVRNHLVICIAGNFSCTDRKPDCLYCSLDLRAAPSAFPSRRIINQTCRYEMFAQWTAPNYTVFVWQTSVKRRSRIFAFVHVHASFRHQQRSFSSSVRMLSACKVRGYSSIVIMRSYNNIHDLIHTRTLWLCYVQSTRSVCVSTRALWTTWPARTVLSCWMNKDAHSTSTCSTI